MVWRTFLGEARSFSGKNKVTLKEENVNFEEKVHFWGTQQHCQRGSALFWVLNIAKEARYTFSEGLACFLEEGMRDLGVQRAIMAKLRLFCLGGLLLCLLSSS